MDNVMMWIEIVGIIVIPAIGWIYRNSIAKDFAELSSKSDSSIKQSDKDRELFFKKFDEAKELYVRKDMYQQATEFHQKEVDTKFENLLGLMNSQFKTVEDKIEDLKELIIKNFNTSQGQK